MRAWRRGLTRASRVFATRSRHVHGAFAAAWRQERARAQAPPEAIRGEFPDYRNCTAAVNQAARSGTGQGPASSISAHLILNSESSEIVKSKTAKILSRKARNSQPAPKTLIEQGI
ncbi:hypothetical protein [Burkholderia glumae]|uniref:hypothetical protein n=1 Tax=Burkholderia glumae TaxID=337 RepID=UPI00157AD8F3|nr:hypothetical protein [Burkholderia glumae]